jgi:hypothetical protein
MIVEIGGIPVRFSTADSRLLEILRARYSPFEPASPSAEPFHLDVETSSIHQAPSQDLEVIRIAGRWRIVRGDFEAECSLDSRTGWIHQCSPNPYSIDTALRILHSLLLVERGGFLLHAASAVRNHRAFVFSGLSGAGKTTISRLAPPDAALLTDEISYIRPCAERYSAFGTPFAGELAKVGENLSAPIETMYLLAQGSENRIDPIAPAEAVRALLRNVLFFSHDPELVRIVFESACDFVNRVPVRRLTFRPTPDVWELIA